MKKLTELKWTQILDDGYGNKLKGTEWVAKVSPKHYKCLMLKEYANGVE